MVGPLLAGLVTQSHGWSDATLTLGCISIFTAIPIVIFTGGSIFEKSKTKQRSTEDQVGELALKVPLEDSVQLRSSHLLRSQSRGLTVRPLCRNAQTICSASLST